MADIINLRRIRKDKARAEDAARAAVNREKFGRSKTEKQQLKSEQERQASQLDGHKRVIDEWPST